jgi:hypothetical protein
MSVLHEGYYIYIFIPLLFLTCGYLFYIKQFIQLVLCNLELLTEMSMFLSLSNQQ